MPLAPSNCTVFMLVPLPDEQLLGTVPNPPVVSPITCIGIIHTLWMAIAVISLAAAAHQGWSANIYTLASDMFPKSFIGSVTGFAGFGGAVGGMLAAWIVGLVLQKTHSYSAIFLVAGTAYLVALAIIQLLVPRNDLVTGS